MYSVYWTVYSVYWTVYSVYWTVYSSSALAPRQFIVLLSLPGYARDPRNTLRVVHCIVLYSTVLRCTEMYCNALHYLVGLIFAGLLLGNLTGSSSWFEMHEWEGELEIVSGNSIGSHTRVNLIVSTTKIINNVSSPFCKPVNYFSTSSVQTLPTGETFVDQSQCNAPSKKTKLNLWFFFYIFTNSALWAELV